MFKNLTDEIKWLQKRIELNPQSMLFARLAERYMQMEEYDQAIDICNRGLEEHPEYSNAHLVLAKCFMKTSDFEQADQEFRRLLSIQSNHLTAHKLYGDLMTHTGWANSAETSYEKILEIDPLETHMKESLGNFTFEVQRSAEPGVNIEPVSEDDDIIHEQEPVDEMFGASAEDSDATIESIFGDEQEDNFSDTSMELDADVAEDIQDTDMDEYRLADETVEALFENESESSDDEFEVESDSVFQDTMVTEDQDDEQFDDIFSVADETESFSETETFGVDASEEQETFTQAFPTVEDKTEEFVLPETEEPELDQDVIDDEMVAENIQPSTDDIFGGAQEDSIFPMTASDDDDDMQLFATDDDQTETEMESETFFETPDETEFEQRETEFEQPEIEESLSEQPILTREEPEAAFDEEEDMPHVANDSVREESDKYSDILDGIFSQDVEEEERKESETRDKLEQVITESEGTSELDDSYNFDEMQIDDDLAANAFFDTDTDDEDDDASPEDLLMTKAEEAELIPEQEGMDTQAEEPHIPDGFMAFEEDDSQEDVETSAVHVQEDDEIDEDEEQFSDFLAGLGDPKEFKDEVVSEYEQEEATPRTSMTEFYEDDKPTAEFISAPEPHDSNKQAESAPADDSEEKPKEKFVTPTLGEIYAAQGQYAKAINVFEMLLEKSPENEWYQSKLEYLRKKLEENE